MKTFTIFPFRSIKFIDVDNRMSKAVERKFKRIVNKINR